MEQKAVNWLIANNKTALASVHNALYHSFKQLFPNLHSRWIVDSLRTATIIVHQFNKRKKKGKVRKPNLKKPFITLSNSFAKVSWDGKVLKVKIPKSPNDLEPLNFSFRPHGKYKQVLDKWLAGDCKIGDVTLTENSISIPFKFADAKVYEPKTVIGVDSNENSLDLFVMDAGLLGSMDTSEISRINRDHDRRIRKATRGKNNAKFKKKVQAKHGRLRKEKTRTLWSIFALMLINLAIQHQAALVLENLKGLKPNISLRQASKKMRQRLLNYWSIMVFHRILEAKCREHGVPIVFVNPKDTSKSCPICGGSLRGQDKECPTCRLSRHYVAAINIACRGKEKFPGVVLPGQGSVSDPCSLSSALKVLWWGCGSTTGTCVS
ncbi:MAG: IS200/IS605 family accessory protein TnpB-related protein [Armatimonadota bacterium]